MKINTKYLSIAIYALAVIAAGALLVIVLFAVRDFWSQKKYETLIYVLRPFLYGFVLAYILNPLVAFFERRVFHRARGRNRDGHERAQLRRVLAVVTALAVTVVVLTLLSLTVAPQISSSVQQLSDHVVELFSPIPGASGGGDITASDPAAIYNELMNRKIGLYITRAAADIQDAISRFGVSVDIERSAQELFLSAAARGTVLFNEYFQTIFNATANFIVATARQVFNLLLAIVAAFYMLVGKERHISQVKRLLYAFFPIVIANKAVDVTRKTHYVFYGFFKGKILDSLIIGVICFICMTIFRIDYPVLIALIVGITNIIPFFGPFIGAIPSIFFLLLSDFNQGLWFTVFILILQQLDANIIGPKIIGDSMGLSSFWIIFAVMVMTGLMGPLGMFIGVPLFGLIYMLLKEFSDWRLAGKGLSPDAVAPSLPPPEDAPPTEAAAVAKISVLVENLAKSIQRYMRANENKRDKKK